MASTSCLCEVSEIKIGFVCLIDWPVSSAKTIVDVLLLVSFNFDSCLGVVQPISHPCRLLADGKH